MRRIILASKSPRRKQLMEGLNLPFEICVADIVENINYQNDLKEEIKKLALLKAQAVLKDNEDSIVIGADTIVVIDNEVLGKPKSFEDAKRMLNKLQGHKHEVITGVSIISKNHIDNFVSISEVLFNEMSEQEIEDYIKTEEPMDKAGAYAIQGIGAKFINSINGDYYAIMGLPIGEVYKRLKQFK